MDKRARHNVPDVPVRACQPVVTERLILVAREPEFDYNFPQL
jgi:hypothetical protein